MKPEFDTSEVFDESIFTDAMYLSQFQYIITYNKVDVHLLGRNRGEWIIIPSDVYDKMMSSQDFETALRQLRQTTLSESENETELKLNPVHLNPNRFVLGLKVYTMKRRHLTAGVRVPRIHQFAIASDEEFRLAEKHKKVNFLKTPFEDPTDVVFTVNDDSQFSDFEQAIILKWYAIHYPNVLITSELYSVVSPHFQSDQLHGRQWLGRSKKTGFSQHANGLVIDNSTGLPFIVGPQIPISGPPISIFPASGN